MVTLKGITVEVSRDGKLPGNYEPPSCHCCQVPLDHDVGNPGEAPTHNVDLGLRYKTAFSVRYIVPSELVFPSEYEALEASIYVNGVHFRTDIRSKRKMSKKGIFWDIGGKFTADKSTHTSLEFSRPDHHRGKIQVTFRFLCNKVSRLDLESDGVSKRSVEKRIIANFCFYYVFRSIYLCIREIYPN